MIIQKADFKDDEFIRPLKKYCISSAPLKNIDIFSSFSCRENAAENFIKDLSKCNLSLVAKTDSGEYIYSVFFFLNGFDFLNILFAAPNQEKKFSISTTRKALYFICLEAIRITNIDTIKAKITRRQKKNPYKVFLKRYFKAIKYKELKDESDDLVYLSKQSILDHCEKLKIKGNWDQFFDETT